MQFKKFAQLVSDKFSDMQEFGILFKSSLSGDELWEIYLKNFKEGHDPIFRDPESSEHNCNLDKNFIRRYGNVVSLNKDFGIVSMFDVDLPADSEYYAPAKAMSKALKNSEIADYFFETFVSLNKLPYEKIKKGQKVFALGFPENTKTYSKEEVEKFGKVEQNKLYTFYHFYGQLKDKFVDTSEKSAEAIVGVLRANKEVFKRGLDEIGVDTYKLVKDLIIQGSLLNAEQNIYKLEAFIEFAKEYSELSKNQKTNWAWAKSYNLPIAKFRGELLGSLCVELSEGMEINNACSKYNKQADPANYMKAKAAVTPFMKKQAAQKIEELGYQDSFNRKLANLSEIEIEEILHINSKGEKKQASVLDAIDNKVVSTKHKRAQFDGIEEVSIEKFMKEILPNCTAIEAFFEKRLDGNLVVLTNSKNSEAKIPFKWNNHFSWTYNGNLAGKSQLTKMVEAKGGRTDGVFRFTHSWNELEPNQSLMDLHVFMPDCKIPKNFEKGPNVFGRRVGWNNRTDTLSGGKQDVDYTNQAPKGYVPVENITFPDLSKMPEGVYTCMIHNWNFRQTGGRGKAEIAFQGNLFQYEYPATKDQEWVTIAEVTLKKGVFSIEHKLPLVEEVSKEIWGLQTNQFHKVNLVSLSPNYWGENNVGHKHYLFMINDCKTKDDVRSFHNENLNQELLEIRKTLEVLGTNLLITPEKNEKQLAGLGFNATVKDEVILKISGSFKRTIKVKF